VFSADLTIADGQRVFSEVMERFPKVDGVLCGNDLCALGVMEGVDKAGLRVGRDVAVMGIDNLPISQLGRIALTSIEEPYEDIASEATRALIDSIEKNSPLSVRRMMPPRLIVRRSTQRS
jgi:LacI family transcriptional regulator